MNKILKIILIGSTIPFSACGLGSAEVSVSSSTVSHSVVNESGCIAAVNSGSKDTTTACSAVYNIEFTATEKGGDCDAENVKVNYKFTSNGSNKVAIVFGNIAAGSHKKITKDITVPNIYQLENIGFDNLKFDANCGGVITGIKGSPLEIEPIDETSLLIKDSD